MSSRGKANAEPERRERGLYRLALGVPLALLAAGVLLTTRPQVWPGPFGDEATYLMAAESLAFDFDFRYTQADRSRYVERNGHQPEGLILQSPDGGKRLIYAKPVVYPLAIAPFVRVGGVRGALFANFLFLVLAGWLAAKRLERRLGEAAWPLVSVAIFASVMFAHVFWIHADLFYACLVAIGLALSLDRERTDGDQPEVTFVSRLGVVCLILVAFARPFYATLLLAPFLFALGRGRSPRTLFAPALVVLAALVTWNILVRENWTSYSGERQGYYQHTGFPGDTNAATWNERLEARGANRWGASEALRQGFDLRQFAWNLIYLPLGQTVGLLPYFMPGLLCLFLLRSGEVRVTLVVLVLAATLAFVIVRPFNFWGGGGSMGNRYFLPLYPALWFTVGAIANGRRVLLAIGATALAASLFLFPTWLHPDAYPRSDDGGYPWVSGFARTLLPYETTQSHLKPAGREDFLHGALWIKPLRPGTRPAQENDQGSPIVWNKQKPGRLLVGSRHPLEQLVLRLSEADVGLRGGRVIERQAAQDGAEQVTLEPRVRAKHPMWWTADDLFLYSIGFTNRSDSDLESLTVYITPHEAQAEGAPL